MAIKCKCVPDSFAASSVASQTLAHLFASGQVQVFDPFKLLYGNLLYVKLVSKVGTGKFR